MAKFTGPRIVIMQVSPGEHGAGYIIITDGSGTEIGYCLAINQALQTPNGTQWPVPGQNTTNVEYWWFATDKLKDIRSGTLTSFSLNSSDLVPVNAQTPPTLASDPLTQIPAQFGSTEYVSWKTTQHPVFSQTTTAKNSTAAFPLFATTDGKVSLGFKYSGSGSGLSLVNQWWGTDQLSSNKPAFWFGSGSGRPTGAIKVASGFNAVSSYTSGTYQKKLMSLVPSSISLS